MLTCLALVAAFNTSSMAEIPSLTARIESEARALSSVTEVSPALVTRIGDFSADTQRLSSLLQTAGVGQDMPCVFQGIAKDARDRAAEFIDADTQGERDAAFMNLRVLMDDTVLLTPVAASAAADRAQQRDVAFR